MEANEYFQQLVKGLEAVYGAGRKTPNGIRFGDIGMEYECIGTTMLVFLSTLNWVRYASWDGAVHIEMQSVRPIDAAAKVQEMMEVGRRRVGK